MSEEKKTEAATAAKTEDIMQKGPSGGTFPKGDPAEKPKDINLDDYVPKVKYEELEAELGKKNTDNGDYEKFFKEISPLLTQLETQPELVQAIMDGKIDAKLAKAVLEDKFQIIEEATKVATKEAQAEVKKELGTKEYKETSPEDIKKMVAEKVEEKIKEAREGLVSEINEIEEKREFENKVSDFIENTPDFVEYADKVNDWLSNHPDQHDIETAYLAVKGKILAEKEKKTADETAGETAKEVAANAAGGQSQGSQMKKTEDEFSKFIAPRSNPNTF